MRRQNGNNSRFIRLQPLPIRILEGLSHLISKPFAEAESLESYGTWGYVFLGCAIAVGTAIAWALGWAGGTDGFLGQYAKVVYEWLGRKIPLPPNFAPTVSLLPILAWFLVFFWTEARLLLGRAFVGGLLGMVDWSLEAGEWCLEHRWASLVLIIVLAMSTTAGGYREWERRTEQGLLVSRFENWLHEAEKFVEYSAMTHSEAVRYRRVSEVWRNNFVDVPDDAGKPAACLKEMLDTLYKAETSGKKWDKHLKVMQGDLEKSLKSCGDPRAASGQDAARAFSLMDITMGRVYVRLFDKQSGETSLSEKKTEDLQLLTNAAAMFHIAEGLEPKIPQDRIEGYRSATRNGMGTVYAGFAGATRTPDWVEKSKECKQDRNQCKEWAFSAFKTAAPYSKPPNSDNQDIDNQNKDDECTFQYKRRENNELDLLVRIGSKYTDFKREKESYDLLRKWSGPGELAQELEDRAQRLMECNLKGDFVLTTVVTTSQAFAVAAELRGGSEYIKNATALKPKDRDESAGIESNQKHIHNDIRSAGLFLLWAYGFEPENVDGWHLSYFCEGLKEPLDKDFKSPTDISPGSLRPASSSLMNLIGEACPK